MEESSRLYTKEIRGGRGDWSDHSHDHSDPYNHLDPR
jgi:hypothetical protein